MSIDGESPSLRLAGRLATVYPDRTPAVTKEILLRLSPATALLYCEHVASLCRPPDSPDSAVYQAVGHRRDS